MKYKVGAHSFDVPKPFKSNSEAVKHVKQIYPHLGEDEILKHLKPSIKKDESNQPSGTIKESSESEKANTKTGERGSDRKQTGKD